MLYEDFYTNKISSLLYPLFDLLKTEIFSMICAFLWNYPFL